MFNIFRREGQFGDVNQITPEEVFKKLSEDKGKNTVIIDVREPHEFSGNLGHIENAKLIPIRLLPLKINELSDYKDKDIIAVCHSGARSYSACSMLKRHGFNNVYNLKGGMLLWKKSGLKTRI
ncbi:MAG: rhodanese-like domain-containing protein [Deltaproteobacteria bacterium]|jgi:rhodanese-related sulfurtransferase|nr:rhodanese-like domain-containing protein [Deltaproteobacteria bacterium]